MNDSRKHEHGSGKQILLRVLLELSTRQIPEDEMDAASRRLRAALLLAGSASDESVAYSLGIYWANQQSSEGELVGQGMALAESGYFVDEIAPALISKSRRDVKLEFPKLSDLEIELLGWLVAVLTSSIGMSTQYLSMESTRDDEGQEWLLARAAETYL